MSFENFNVFSLDRIVWLDGTDLYKLLREELGDTDMYSKLQDRAWYTTPGGDIYIRKDIEIPKCITAMLLIQRTT